MKRKSTTSIDNEDKDAKRRTLKEGREAALKWAEEQARLKSEKAKSKRGQSDIAPLNNKKRVPEKSNENALLEDEILNNLENELTENKPTRPPRRYTEIFSPPTSRQLEIQMKEYQSEIFSPSTSRQSEIFSPSTSRQSEIFSPSISRQLEIQMKGYTPPSRSNFGKRVLNRSRTKAEEASGNNSPNNESILSSIRNAESVENIENDSDVKEEPIHNTISLHDEFKSPTLDKPSKSAATDKNNEAVASKPVFDTTTPSYVAAVVVAAILIVYALFPQEFGVLLETMQTDVGKPVQTSLAFFLQHVQFYGLRGAMLAVIAILIFAARKIQNWMSERKMKQIRKARKIALDVKDLLKKKSPGVPFPISFLKEEVCDKIYEGTSAVAPSDLQVSLDDGLPAVREVVSRLWPLVQEEVQADTRVQAISGVVDGKSRSCWRFMSGSMTALTGLVGDGQGQGQGQGIGGGLGSPIHTNGDKTLAQAKTPMTYL